MIPRKLGLALNVKGGRTPHEPANAFANMTAIQAAVATAT